MRVESVAIEDIVTNRTLRPDDDLADLEKSMEKVYLKTPILLLPGNILIDGLRRVEVFKKNGRGAISCVRATTFDECIQHIAATTKNREGAQHGNGWPVWRLAQLWQDTQEYRHLRGRHQRQPDLHQGPRPEGSSRKLMAHAIGLRSETNLDYAVRIYRSITDDPEADAYRRELVTLLEAGKMGLKTTDTKIKNFYRMREKTFTANEQKTVFEETLALLDGVIRGLNGFETRHPDLDPELFLETEKKLKKYTTALRAFTTAMRKGSPTR